MQRVVKPSLAISSPLRTKGHHIRGALYRTLIVQVIGCTTFRAKIIGSNVLFFTNDTDKCVTFSQISGFFFFV